MDRSTKERGAVLFAFSKIQIAVGDGIGDWYVTRHDVLVRSGCVLAKYPDRGILATHWLLFQSAGLCAHLFLAVCRSG